MSSVTTVSDAVSKAILGSPRRPVILAGVVGIASGILALASADKTAFVLGACVATYLLALMIARIPAASALAGLEGARRMTRSLLVILALIAALLLIDPDLGATLAIVIGFTQYVLLSVVMGLAIAARYRPLGKLLAAEGLLAVLVVAAVVGWLQVDAVAATTVVGAGLVLRGVVDLAIALALRELSSPAPAGRGE